MAYGNMWEINLSHEGLNKSCLIKGSDRYVVEQKAIAQRRTWDVEESTLKLESILQQSLYVSNAVVWDTLLNHEQFPEKEPVKTNPTNKPLKPQLFSAPPEPIEADLKYQPKITLLDKLLFLNKIKLKDANKLFMFDYEEWVNIEQQLNQRNRWLESVYTEELKKWEINKTEHEHREDENIANWDIYKTKHEQREDRNYKGWEIRKNKYEEDRISKNHVILEIKNRYFDNSAKAIIEGVLNFV